MAGPTHLVIEEEDPTRDDVRRLVPVHREWSLQQTPREFSFSVEPQAVTEAGITLLGARTPDGELLGIVGLKMLEDGHGEVKTMHTAAAARGHGVGRQLLTAVLDEARQRGCARVSLETGTGEAFRPARALYESAGFRPGEPFGDYANTDYNLCMSLQLPQAGANR